jgi:hypothetical protein
MAARPWEFKSPPEHQIDINQFMNQKTLYTIFGIVIVVLIIIAVYFTFGRTPASMTQSNMTPDQIFQEVSSQLGLTRSKLDYFRIFGQDKVTYSAGGPESGANYVYKQAGKWHIAQKGAQDVRPCSEFNNVPEQYRPVCVDPAATATGQLRYADSQGQDVNYPLSQMIPYIGQ